jgi:hypothetical protein
MKLVGRYMVIILSGAVTACSGSKDAASSALGGGFGSTVSAQFIDAPVKGLAFTTSSNANGLTMDQGMFSCKLGEVVNFSLKGFDLGQAACGETIFIHDLFAPEGISNYKWEQAAAVIQSFATGSTELDLSAVNSSSTDLSSLTYNNDDSLFDAAVQTKANEAAIPDTNHKTTNDAKTAADDSLADLISINDELKSALDNLVQNHFGYFIVNTELTSGTIFEGVEQCANYLDAWMDVEKSTVNSKDIYTLKPRKAISYNQLEDARSDVVCVDKPDSTCRAVNNDLLPKKKTITGSDFAVASTANITDYQEITGLNLSSYLTASLATTTIDNFLDVTGTTIYNEMIVTDSPEGFPPKDYKIKCLYNLIIKTDGEEKK